MHSPGAYHGSRTVAWSLSLPRHRTNPTMTESLVPAADEFVVQSPASSKSALDRLRDLGKVERIDAAEPLLVLKVAGAKRAKDAWAAAAAKLGETRLFPVLYDSEGAPHYPTGEVTVRFDAAPSDADLRRFGDSHKLRLLRRNEFAPQQAVFEPVGRPRRVSARRRVEARRTAGHPQGVGEYAVAISPRGQGALNRAFARAP